MTVIAPPMGELALCPHLEFVAYGTPAPQGSKSFKGITRAGRAILAESSKKVKPWRVNVHDACAEAIAVIPGFEKLDGPLAVEMVFTLAKPLSAPKRRRTWPTKYPDVSKLCRSTEDAISSAGGWADDARVVEYRRLAKVFPGEDRSALPEPGVVVRVWRLDGVV